jgi:hypothetical protein
MVPQILLPQMQSLSPPPHQTELYSSTLHLPSINGHNLFILANVEVIKHVVPSSLIAVAADDGGLVPPFPPDPLLQCSSNTGVRIRAAGLFSSHPRQQLALDVSRYVFSFVLAVGAVLM